MSSKHARQQACAFFAALLLVIGGRERAAADALDQCGSVKDLLAKNQVSQALREVHALNDLVLDKFMDALRALFPEKVGAFSLEKNSNASVSGSDTAAKMKRTMGNFASYKAEGFPVMNVLFGSAAQPGASVECTRLATAPKDNIEGPIKVGERDAYVRKQLLGRFTSTLCLKGGDVKVTSDSATKEQLLQFLKDIPPSNLAKMEELFAPIAEAGK